MGEKIPEVVTLITAQNDLAQKSGKNDVTVALIDLPLVCHTKYHGFNINTVILTILRNLHVNAPQEFRIDRIKDL